MFLLFFFYIHVLQIHLNLEILLDQLDKHLPKLYHHHQQILDRTQLIKLMCGLNQIKIIVEY